MQTKKANNLSISGEKKDIGDIVILQVVDNTMKLIFLAKEIMFYFFSQEKITSYKKFFLIWGLIKTYRE